MTGVNPPVKRSATAAAANTDTVIVTPAMAQKVKILTFWVTNEAAAQVAGMNFEIRYGAQILGIAGFDSASAVVGATTKTIILNAEIIGDGVTPIQARNLTLLNTGSNVAYCITCEVTA